MGRPSPLLAPLAVVFGLSVAGCKVFEAPPAPEASPSPAAAAGAAQAPVIGGCSVFPADNAWNRDVSADPVDALSDAYVASINADENADRNEAGEAVLHADFGSNPEYGIPYAIVPETQPLVPIEFTEYGNESDPGPYPIPADAPVQPGDDHHVLVVQSGTCKLYELYHAEYAGPGWRAGAGAVFDLRSNALRPATWTSTDEAGLPVLPGLVKYDEVAAGQITHALRFTVGLSGRGWVPPATHYGQSDDPNVPPMGARLRLKAGFDTSRYSGQARVILDALKRYGMFVADTGYSWFISGQTDSRWNDEDLDQLKTVPGSAFEVVATGTIQRPNW